MVIVFGIVISNVGLQWDRPRGGWALGRGRPLRVRRRSLAPRCPVRHPPPPRAPRHPEMNLEQPTSKEGSLKKSCRKQMAVKMSLWDAAATSRGPKGPEVRSCRRRLACPRVSTQAWVGWYEVGDCSSSLRTKQRSVASVSACERGQGHDDERPNRELRIISEDPAGPWAADPTSRSRVLALGFTSNAFWLPRRSHAGYPQQPPRKSRPSIVL